MLRAPSVKPPATGSLEARSPHLAAQQNPTPNSPPIRYHSVVMSLSVVLVKILEYMFVAGWAGSAVVLVLTGIEDVGTLLDRKDENSH